MIVYYVRVYEDVEKKKKKYYRNSIYIITKSSDFFSNYV